MSFGISEALFNFITGSFETSPDTTKYEEIDDLKSLNDHDCTIQEIDKNVNDFDIPEKLVIQKLINTDIYETSKFDEKRDDCENVKIKDTDFVNHENEDKMFDKENNSVDEIEQIVEKYLNAEDEDKQNLENNDSKKELNLVEESFDKKVSIQLEDVIDRKSKSIENQQDLQAKKIRENRKKSRSRVRKNLVNKIQDKQEIIKKIDEENAEIKQRLIEIDNELELLRNIFHDMNPGKELPVHLEKGYNTFKDTLSRYAPRC